MVDASVQANAGIVKTTRGECGCLFSIYNGIEAEMDTEAGKWQTVCEEHGTVCSHTNYKHALAHLPTGIWCEECQAEASNG